MTSMQIAALIAFIVMVIVTCYLSWNYKQVVKNPQAYVTPNRTGKARKRARNVAAFLLVSTVLFGAWSFWPAILPNLNVFAAPVGKPLEFKEGVSQDGEPEVGNLSNDGADAQAGNPDEESKADDAGDKDGKEASGSKDEAVEAFHFANGELAKFFGNEVKGYYVPAVNPTEDEIIDYLKDFDIETGSNDSLIEQADARLKSAAAMSGKYTDPVDFSMPEEFRTGFRQLAKGKLSQKEREELEKKFRHWDDQKGLTNVPWGLMKVQMLSELPRVTKNNPWISRNLAIVPTFYDGTYRQPQLGDANYDELMTIEFYAIPTATDPNMIGLDYFLVASDKSPTGFKPNDAWIKLMARVNMLIDEYFDIEGYVELQSAHNWRMPKYSRNSDVITKEAPYQVDEPAIMYAYHHTTGEAAEFGTGEFGIVEDDCRLELYAEKKTPNTKSSPPPDRPDETPKPTPTPPPTSTPTPTPTPSGTPTPTPEPSKNPEEDPANQGKVPIGGGENSDPTNPGGGQPDKPPAISQPTSGIDIVGSGQHESTGTGGNANSVTNPNGNTQNGDHPGQNPDKVTKPAATGTNQVTGGSGSANNNGNETETIGVPD